MPQVYLVNPRKRTRARRKASAARRKASPAQLAARARFAAMARARSAAPKRRRARSRVRANPAPTRARRSHRKAVHRSIRRNPISRGSLTKIVTQSLTDAAIAGAGGVAIDIAMAQALKVLPESARSRSTLEGNINWLYYGSKAALAIAAGIVGTKYTHGKTRELIAKGVQGSLGIQAYEIIRATMPADLIQMAYYAPAVVAQNAGRLGNGSQPTGQNTARLAYYARPRAVGMSGSAGGQIGSQMSMQS